MSILEDGKNWGKIYDRESNVMAAWVLGILSLLLIFFNFVPKIWLKCLFLIFGGYALRSAYNLIPKKRVI